MDEEIRTLENILCRFFFSIGRIFFSLRKLIDISYYADILHINANLMKKSVLNITVKKYLKNNGQKLFENFPKIKCADFKI